VLAAVDVDLGAVDVGTGLGAEHIDDLGHFIRRAEAMQRDLLLDDLLGARRPMGSFPGTDAASR
jgi:hypothetical protein